MKLVSARWPVVQRHFPNSSKFSRPRLMTNSSQLENTAHLMHWHPSLRRCDIYILQDIGVLSRIAFLFYVIWYTYEGKPKTAVTLFVSLCNSISYS